jgi:hypothetical protein
MSRNLNSLSSSVCVGIVLNKNDMLANVYSCGFSFRATALAFTVALYCLAFFCVGLFNLVCLVDIRYDFNRIVGSSVNIIVSQHNDARSE